MCGFVLRGYHKHGDGESQEITKEWMKNDIQLFTTALLNVVKCLCYDQTDYYLSTFFIACQQTDEQA